MSQSDIEVSASEPGTSRFGIEASPELVTSQADIEASWSQPGTSQFDIEASQRAGPMSQPYYGAVFDAHWAPSWPPRLCRRRRLSICAGIGRIPPRLAAIGTSANSSSTISLDARAQWSETRTSSVQPTDEVPSH